MLVHVHGPKIGGVGTFDKQGDSNAFHTVTLIESYADRGEVRLFIKPDWSDWDAMVAQVTEYRQVAAVRALGAEHGRAAGSWVEIDTTEQAQKIIDGNENGDPEVMDMQPSPLSGEWADGVTSDDVLAAAGIVDSDADIAVTDDLLNEYESAFADAYWQEVLRAAQIIAEPEFIQTACRGCGLDIEGEVGGSEWRDRGNNTMCPETDDAHEPIEA